MFGSPSSSSARHCATANTEELVAINTALHYLGQGELPLPLMLVGAGLPSLPAQLADATSYAERLYDYRPVGLLDRPAAVDALTIPTRALGVDWDDTALAMSADVAGGYPYFLQAIGKHVWDNAINSPISADDVGWECATLAARSTTGFTAPGGNAPHLRNETCCARWPTQPVTGQRRCLRWHPVCVNRAPVTSPSRATN